MQPTAIEQLNQEWQQSHPKAILKAAFDNHQQIAISFSGAEDVVLIDLALKVASKERVRVFCLDTGRLHAETLAFIDQVRQHYQINIDVRYPEHLAVEALVNEKGLFSFYQDGHKECCSVRKIDPLRRQLLTLDAWITGQRRDQSPSTRSQVAIIEQDAVFAGQAGALVKYNPLANWSSAEVWEYIRMFDVPFNPLHQQGFVSIGCQPCTRAVLPNQHEREGRWWWEEGTQKECGLHAANIISQG